MLKRVLHGAIIGGFERLGGFSPFEASKATARLPGPEGEMAGKACYTWFIRGFIPGVNLPGMIIPGYSCLKEGPPWGYSLGVEQERGNPRYYTFSQEIIVFAKVSLLVQHPFL